MKIDQIYYTPQQLASFFSIKKDTLLYYDRIGLFSPDVRNKNGYRYYTAAKLNELDSILTMRDLGLSINAIKEVVGRLDTPSFLELLSKEEESVQEKMSECRKTLSIVRKIKNNIKTIFLGHVHGPIELFEALFAHVLAIIRQIVDREVDPDDVESEIPDPLEVRFLYESIDIESLQFPDLPLLQVRVVPHGGDASRLGIDSRLKAVHA